MEIAEQVKDFIINKILIGASDVTLDSDESFLQRGILNSTGILELVGFLEGHFKITCKDEDITPENLDSLKAVSAYVQRKLSPQ
jgi:acyl carrier protein